jgi:hypothetical protein
MRILASHRFIVFVNAVPRILPFLHADHWNDCVSCLSAGLLAIGLAAAGLVCLIRGMSSRSFLVRPSWSTHARIHELEPASATRANHLPPRLRGLRCAPAVWFWMQLLFGAPDFALAQSWSVCAGGSVFNTSLSQCVACPGGVFCLGGANPAIACPAGMLSRLPVFVVSHVSRVFQTCFRVCTRMVSVTGVLSHVVSDALSRSTPFATCLNGLNLHSFVVALQVCIVR